MKKSIIFFILLFNILGCYYSLNTKNDEITKTTFVTLDIWHEAIEGDLYNYLMRYTKKIQNNKISNSSIIIQSYRYYSEPQFDENGSIIIDDKIYNIKVIERSTLDMGRNVLLCGKIEIPNNVEKGIINCKDFKIRIYALEKPTTYKANKKELEKVKEFFSVNASSINTKK